MDRYIACLMPALLLLGGCAATPYQPSDPNGYGYADQQLSAGIYDVMFVANTATSAQEVEDFALLHAAELGTAQGYAYLSVEDRKSGNLMLAPAHAPGKSYTPPTQGSATGGERMGMYGGMGNGGAYNGVGGSNSMSFSGSATGGDPARACVLRVHFYKQDGSSHVSSARDIKALITKLDAEYSIPVSAGDH